LVEAQSTAGVAVEDSLLPDGAHLGSPGLRLRQEDEEEEEEEVG